MKSPTNTKVVSHARLPGSHLTPIKLGRRYSTRATHVGPKLLLDRSTHVFPVLGPDLDSAMRLADVQLEEGEVVPSELASSP